MEGFVITVNGWKQKNNKKCKKQQKKNKQRQKESRGTEAIMKV